ncbi:trypsin-like serine protease [Geminicoccaceae bacterium SYSU G07066]|uniref:Serine protease n=2 Tax=Benzoatithermus flavus TaxID=3108223 RepID=A0ABU8XKD9_9PROT
MDPRKLREALTTVAISPDGRKIKQPPTAQEVSAFLASLQERFTGGRNPARDRVSSETVIGPDTRTRIFATTAAPWRAIGRIENEARCTGTLIGSRYVLTAGHCVYDLAREAFYPGFRFAPARNGSKTPYGVIGWKKAITTLGYMSQGLRDFDFALIVLSQDVGNRTGWFRYGWKDPMPLYGIAIDGYPADKPPGTMWHAGCKLAPPTGRHTQRLYYPCDTSGGMSGSAIYARLAGGSPIVYGIHGYGVDGTGLNSGVRITRFVYDKLRTWQATYR